MYYLKENQKYINNKNYCIYHMILYIDVHFIDAKTILISEDILCWSYDCAMLQMAIVVKVSYATEMCGLRCVWCVNLCCQMATADAVSSRGMKRRGCQLIFKWNTFFLKTIDFGVPNKSLVSLGLTALVSPSYIFHSGQRKVDSNALDWYAAVYVFHYRFQVNISYFIFSATVANNLNFGDRLV